MPTNHFSEVCDDLADFKWMSSVCWKVIFSDTRQTPYCSKSWCLYGLLPPRPPTTHLYHSDGRRPQGFPLRQIALHPPPPPPRPLYRAQSPDRSQSPVYRQSGLIETTEADEGIIYYLSSTRTIKIVPGLQENKIVASQWRAVDGREGWGGVGWWGGGRCYPAYYFSDDILPYFNTVCAVLFSCQPPSARAKQGAPCFTAICRGFLISEACLVLENSTWPARRPAATMKVRVTHECTHRTA